MQNSTRVRFKKGRFTPVPYSLTSRCDCRAQHIATFVALWQIADWNSLRGVIKDQRDLAQRARLSPNTIFGGHSHGKGSLPDLVDFGFVEILGRDRKRSILYQLHLEPIAPSRAIVDRAFAPQGAAFAPQGAAFAPQGADPPLYTDSFQILSNGAAELPPDDVVFETPIGQKAVQHYVDTCMEIGYSPTEEWKSLCGRNAKKLGNSGKTLDLIWSAIERVARGRKSPSALLHVAADVEAGIPESGNYRANGHKPFQNASLSEWEDPKNHVIG